VGEAQAGARLLTLRAGGEILGGRSDGTETLSAWEGLYNARLRPRALYMAQVGPPGRMPLALRRQAGCCSRALAELAPNSRDPNGKQAGLWRDLFSF
jgi:hypothetical protein